MAALEFIPPSVLRWLPKTSREFGPPRRWAVWKDFHQTHPDAHWQSVFPATPCRYSQPDAPPELARRLWRDGWPELGVATIPAGRVLDEEGWPVGASDTLVIDLATGLDRPEYTAYLLNACRMDPGYGGRALNLGTVYARGNYCHFLLEALPRLELFWRAGFSFDDVDWILVPDFAGTTRDELLRRLGLPKAKIIPLQPNRQYGFRELLQPAFPGREAFLAPWVAAFYRERLLKPAGIKQERRLRLYVTRSQRGLINENEVWAALQQRGFIRIEPMTWEENVHAFAAADLIVGPHGAGLSNVIFSPAGGRLIELIPGDRPFPFFYSAAASAGLHYSALLTSPLRPEGREYRRLPSEKAYSVNLDALLAKVDAYLAKPPV